MKTSLDSKRLLSNTITMRYVKVYFFLLMMFSLPAIVLLAVTSTRLQSKAAGTDQTVAAAPVATSGVFVSFGAAGVPDQSWNTAAKLASALSDSKMGIELKEVSRWKNGGWDTHVSGLPFNDFAISAGQGYLLKFNKYPGKDFARALKFSRVVSQTFQFGSGWNLFSVPNLARSYRAEDICVETKKAGLTITEVNDHPDQGASNFWVKHACGSKTDNFALVANRAYFAKNSGTATVSFTLPSRGR